jgi:hypothetical protein
MVVMAVGLFVDWLMIDWLMIDWLRVVRWLNDDVLFIWSLNSGYIWVFTFVEYLT